MDYKNTLNLPRTDFPMKADLVAREPRRLENWQQTRLYSRIQERRQGAPRFVLHDGPPFTNGDVHIGTALNKILKDIIIKYRTLAGQRAPFVPGWDTHGLPIEFKVSQEMRKANQVQADPVTIRNACEEYAREYMGIQTRQFQRLGVLGDWDNPYATLHPQYEADELRLFADIVEKGFVYRGKKPVYWSIPCRTALAEAEVEYKDHISQSLYVRFPVVGHRNLFLLLWTTTPWTLPANLAVAYNSAFQYVMARAGEASFIVSNMLLPAIAEKCGWAGYEIVRSLYAEDLQGLEFQHPFCARTGRLFAGDSFVENTTGTGFVHIAPGHGLEDYSLGLEHGLPVYSPVDDDGRFVHTADLPREQQMPAELVGKAILEKNGRSEANEAVLEILRQRDMLEHQEKYHHSYPHCWRSKTPVIFRAMDQWFINIDHDGFREKVLATIGSVRWIPDWGRNRIEAAVKSRPDWCISRQRTWGVPIPAFYDPQGQPILDAQIIRNAADLIEKQGSNVWFEKSAPELWSLLKPKNRAGPDAVSKSADTLDVWIDSGSSSRSVLMRRPEFGRETETKAQDRHAWQADMYLEGSDQHRGWFQSSLLLSLAGNGAPPYGTVLTHGFMVDEDREKFSKSKTYEKPQTAEAYVNRYGADIVRLWVASQDFRNDIIVSEKRIETVGETYRILRNSLRYQLSNLYDFDPERHAVPDAQLTSLDRWIFDEFAGLTKQVRQAYDECEFHVVYQKISQFAAVELSAIYHDAVKDRLYTDAANSPRRRATQTTLYRLVTGLARLLSPVLVFTSDEAWDFVPGKTADSVHLTDWPEINFSRPDTERAAWHALFDLRERALPELEKARQAKVIGKALEAKLSIAAPPVSFDPANASQEALRELLNVSQLDLTRLDEGSLVSVNVAHADGRKCERCWHWEIEVGTHSAHPTLCGRCVKALS